MQLMNTIRLSAVITLITVGMAAAQGTPAKPAPKPASPPAEEKQEHKSGNPVTDGWITMKIHSQFIPEDALDDSNIDVDTNAGVVTLNGTVATDAGHKRAVEIAKATDGVKSVRDNLKVAPAVAKASGTGTKDTSTAKAGGRRVNDGWIKSKIYSQFLGENALENSDIDIDVHDGNVALNGTVASDAGRTRAVAIAKATDGVKDVKDTLKVAKK